MHVIFSCTYGLLSPAVVHLSLPTICFSINVYCSEAVHAQGTHYSVYENSNNPKHCICIWDLIQITLETSDFQWTVLIPAFFLD